MSRQRNAVLRVLMWATLVVSQPCTAQVCKTFDPASAEDAIRSLDRGEIQGSYCTRAAFRLIEHLPQGQAIPILIKHLSYNWPLSNEAHGLRSYPAVESLADIGVAAEPALIDFVAHHENESDIEHANALEALAMIHHFDAVPAIRSLRERSLAVAGTPAAPRLDSAADYMLNQFCPSALRKRCEERLRRSDPDK
jgi:hypothetical protein